MWQEEKAIEILIISAHEKISIQDQVILNDKQYITFLSMLMEML